MLPKKTKDLIPQQAKKEGIPEDDLWDMVNFYFHQVSKATERMLHPRIKIDGLGILGFKHWRADDTQMQTEQFIKIHRVLEEDKKTIERVKRGEYAEYTRNYITSGPLRGKRTQYEPKGHTTEGLGEQEPDS